MSQKSSQVSLVTKRTTKRKIKDFRKTSSKIVKVIRKGKKGVFR